MSDAPTHDDFRQLGFTGDAAQFPRTERQFLMICAWAGLDPALAPATWRYFPNQSVREAWERVEAVFDLPPSPAESQQ